MRQIPRGYGFSLVSCPNYLFEGIAWSAFVALTGDYAGALILPSNWEDADSFLLWGRLRSGVVFGDFGGTDVGLGAEETCEV